jgi:hypothetical protein
LDRLEAYLYQVKGIDTKRSRINELLLREGLRWRQQESWFGERVDPDFTAKSLKSNGSMPSWTISARIAPRMCCCSVGYRLLECPSSSLCVGQASSSSFSPPIRYRFPS